MIRSLRCLVVLFLLLFWGMVEKRLNAEGFAGLKEQRDVTKGSGFRRKQEKFCRTN